MSKVVFVLGAGASTHCGTPLMKNFLEIAEERWRQKEFENVSESFRRIFDVVGNLHSIQSKAKLDTYNIETIYSALEMGKLLGRLPGIKDVKETDELLLDIRKVIGYTLERTTLLEHDDHFQPQPPKSYEKFASILEELNRKNGKCAVLTFNYDLGLDFALKQLPIDIDYGLDDIDLTGHTSLPLLKLHGSINWGICPKCSRVQPLRRFDNILPKTKSPHYWLSMLDIQSKQTCAKCGSFLASDPFIVPPTWNKTAFHSQIGTVWRRAAKELQDAEHIFVLGYSLPSSDLFFHYLFALGVEMKTILKGFYVYDLDPEVQSRFAKLLGSGVEERFHFIQVSFEQAVSNSIPGYLLINGRTIPQYLHL